MSVSTHVLDAVRGRPAAGIPVTLSDDSGELATAVTDREGRVAELAGDLDPGVYRLRFAIEDYQPDGFYPEVEIAFRVRVAGSHHHVPLLLSPFAYTTYLGS